MENITIEMTDQEYLSFLKWKKNRYGWQILPLFLTAIAIQIRLFEIWFGIKII